LLRHHDAITFIQIEHDFFAAKVARINVMRKTPVFGRIHFSDHYVVNNPQIYVKNQPIASLHSSQICSGDKITILLCKKF